MVAAMTLGFTLTMVTKKKWVGELFAIATRTWVFLCFHHFL